MGFGDERNRQPSEEVIRAARALADTLHPDLDTVPGGSHHVHREIRESTAKYGATILDRLAHYGLIDIEEIWKTYGGK